MWSVSGPAGREVSWARAGPAWAPAPSHTLSGVGTPSFTAFGGSLTGVIVTLTVAVSVPPWPSLTVYVNVSLPYAFAFGLYEIPVPPPVIVATPLAPSVFVV